MEKRLLLGVASLALAAGAQAQETTWKVEFLDVMGHSYGWSPDPGPPPPFAPTILSGLVRGEDRNRDGWIERSELSELRFGNDGLTGNYATCGTWGDSNNHCTLDRFEFAPEGALGPSFGMTARWVEAPSDRESRIIRIETGKEYEYEFYRERYGSYVWTPDTSLRVTQVSAVPEPAGGLLLAAGLAVVLGARRLRHVAACGGARDGLITAG